MKARIVDVAISRAWLEAAKGAAVLNGLTAARVMDLIMIMAFNRTIMGKFVVPPYLRIAGWVATVVMSGVGVGYS